MPAINLIISEADHKKLQEDYEKMSLAWVQQGRHSAPPPFEHWAGERLIGAPRISVEEIDHIRVFSAVEQLITSLHVHGFCLTHVAGHAIPPEKSAQEMAQALAQHFELPTHYIKRLQDVLAYYQKSPDNLVDGEHGKSMLYSASAIEAAYEEFLDRTTKALDHLDTERAIGRVEGVAALLVSLEVMERETARDKTHAFKLLARGMKKI